MYFKDQINKSILYKIFRVPITIIIIINELRQLKNDNQAISIILLFFKRLASPLGISPTVR